MSSSNCTLHLFTRTLLLFNKLQYDKSICKSRMYSVHTGTIAEWYHLDLATMSLLIPNKSSKYIVLLLSSIEWNIELIDNCPADLCALHEQLSPIAIECTACRVSRNGGCWCVRGEMDSLFGERD